MNDATIIAIVILGGVFILMLVTVVKHGVEAAAKLWSVMGALTGVAFGAITSFYFTNKANQFEIRQALLQKKAAIEALDTASKRAVEANTIVMPIAAALKGEPEGSPSFLSTKAVSSIPPHERAELTKQVDQVSTHLHFIEDILKNQSPENVKLRQDIEKGKSIPPAPLESK